MTGGFSFCGTDIASIGLVYVPETSSMYAPYSGATFNVNASTDGTGNGGYFYGTTLKPKEFTLRCLFEDQDVRDGIMFKVLNLFKRGRTGKLVFKNAEWLWWNATVTNVVDTTKFTNYMNGFVTIQLTAYYPFARSNYLTLDSVPSAMRNNVVNNSGMIEAARMPNQPTKNSVKALIYNPGTETACCAIKIKGNMTNGITIKNNTTNQECTISGVNTGSKYIIVDSMNGKTVLYDPNEDKTENAFLYHRGGFIDLAPAGEVIRNFSLQLTPNNYPGIDPRITVGRWIVFNNHNVGMIESISGDTMITHSYDSNVPTTLIPNNETVIECMNEITISKKSGTKIDSIEFIYKATFR